MLVDHLKLASQLSNSAQGGKVLYLWHKVLDLLNLIPQIPHLLTPLLFPLPDSIHSLLHLTDNLVHLRPLARHGFLQLSRLLL